VGLGTAFLRTQTFKKKAEGYCREVDAPDASSRRASSQP
jgi:hypothetical protein